MDQSASWLPLTNDRVEMAPHTASLDSRKPAVIQIAGI